MRSVDHAWQTVGYCLVILLGKRGAGGTFPPPAAVPTSLILRLLRSNFGEHDGLCREVLEFHDVITHDNLRRVRQRPLPFAIGTDLHLNQRERVLNRSRLTDGFPETDWTIGGEHNLPASIGTRTLMRVPKVIRQ